MATLPAMIEKVKESTIQDEKDAKQWLLPVWRDSIVSEGEADLTDVSFYPYATKEDDPIFVVVGIGLITIYQYESYKKLVKAKIKPLLVYRDKDDAKYIHKDDPDKAEKPSANLGDKDKHFRSRAITWARRDDGLPLLCFTGAGNIQPSKKVDAIDDEPAFIPPIAINTLIKVINPYTGQRIQTLIGHGKTGNALATSPALPHILASCADDKIIYLWSLARLHTKARCIAVIGGWGHIDRVLSISWHADGNWLLSGGFDNRVCLWHVPVTEMPEWDQPCEAWLAKQVLVPYFVSREVHRRPVERVRWVDDMVVSHGMAEPYVSQWLIQGFSSVTPAELLSKKPSFYDQDARTRSAWEFADRDKDQYPLYWRLLRFEVLEAG